MQGNTLAVTTAQARRPPECPDGILGGAGVTRFPDCSSWLHDVTDTTLSTDTIVNGKCRFGFKQSNLPFGRHCTVVCNTSLSDLQSVQCECTSRMEARFGIMFTSAVYQGGWLALGLMSSVATTLVVCCRLTICTSPDEQEIARRLKKDGGADESKSDNCDRYEGSQEQRCHKILGAIVFCVGPILLLVALFGMAGAKLTEFFAGKFLITSAGVRSPSDQDRTVAEGGPALIKTTFWIGCTDAGILADPASVADPSNLNWAGSVVVVLAAALVVIVVPIYCFHCSCFLFKNDRTRGKSAASTSAELNVEEASASDSASPYLAESSI